MKGNKLINRTDWHRLNKHKVPAVSYYDDHGFYGGHFVVVHNCHFSHRNYLKKTVINNNLQILKIEED